MKKLIFFCSMLLILLIPWKAKGVEIISTSITGPKEVSEGENITINIKANITGLQPQIKNPIGINAVLVTFSFDENVFIPTQVSSDGFTSGVYQTENGRYLIVSEANNQNNCGGGQLYCGDYNANLTFYTKETTKETSSFQLSMVAIQYIDIETYDTEEDAMEEIKEVNQSYSVTIKKKEITLPPPKDIITPNTTTPSISIKEKSSNALLASLEIENYQLEFDKNKTDYTIEVDQSINSLSIKPTLEDSKATYKVLGADDLKANQYHVVIEVVAENGLKKNYTIDIKTKKQEEQETNVEEKELTTTPKEKAKINKKFIIYFGSLFVGIFIILVISLIISKIRSRKLDKMLDNL